MASTFHSWALRSALALVAGACAAGTPPTTSTPSSREDFLRAQMDPSADPGVDFFQYALGGWLKRTPIPASETRWDIGSLLREQLYTNLRTINEQAAAAKAAPGSDTQKVGDFWATAMDTARAEKLGLEPLRPELARVDALKGVQDALDLAFAWGPLGVETFFSCGVYQDEKDSSVMAVHLGQGGLGLPERDFYFNAEKGVAKVRAAYVDHLVRLLVLLGRDEASARDAAHRVMAFETELARASRRMEDLRDPQKNYNKMSVADMTAQHTPSIAWDKRLATWNLKPGTLIVGQPEFFDTLENLLALTSVDVLRDYMRLQLVDDFSGTLSKAFVDESFRFHGQAMRGQKEPRERWKRVLDAQEGAMGMVLGKLFVKEHFPPAAKRRYENLVEGIRGSYLERIDRLDWMSAETKAKAKAKLVAVTKKVGYPDVWKDTSALQMGRDSYCANMMRAHRWHFDDMISKFGKPVDRTEWDMTPQTYNAYYNPSNNEIVLPAAQFLIPFVADAKVDDAVAYGYSGGSTIGHEITHGFDDEGRQFDAAGNLTDWWTKEDGEKFQVRAEVMVKQFNAFEPIPGIHINGKASLGENIADFGGILLGLDAFKKTEQYRKGVKIGGLTPLQRYFLGYALGWMSQTREEQLRTQLLSDVHAPAKWRVIGPLSNIPEFYEAFGVKEGQPMWRPADQRVRIW